MRLNPPVFVQRGAQPDPDRLRHAIRIAAQLLGAVLGQLRDRRPGVVPVAGAVLVEVGGPGGQPPEGVPEDGGRFARQDAAELDAPVFDSALRGPGRRRRPEIDGAGDAPAGRALAQVGDLAVDPRRQGLRAVDVLLDDRHPVLRQVAGQLELDPWVVDRQVGGQDERVAVALLPEAVDDRRHQSQHAAGPLERHQRRPVRVQAVEDLRMDRVCGRDPLFVVGGAALRRELLVLTAVEVGERAHDDVAVLEPLRVGERLEQSPADDLEAFLGAGRPPRRLDAPDDVAQPVERLAPALAADLDVVGARVRRVGVIRRRETDDQQAIAGELDGFGERLGEGELRLEAAGRQVALIVELPRVGDPLVDQDQTRPVVDQQLPQGVARAGGAFVVLGDARVGLRAADLPRQLAPHRAHHRAVVLGDRIARRDAVAHQNRGLLPVRQRRDAGVPHQRVYAGQRARGNAGAEVVEREHRVGLAAAEVGLQLHDRVAAAAREPLHRADEHPLEALGQVGAPEELDRVAVLVGPLAQVNLPEVGGELGLLIAAARHVPVRRHHLAPGLQRSGRTSEGEARLLAALSTRLLVEAHAQQLHLELLDVGGLGRRDSRQQAVHRIQRPVGVVAGEGLLMRPTVPMAAQLADEAAFRRPEDHAEHVVPRVPHQLEQRRDVPFRYRPIGDLRVIDEPPQRGGVDPLRLDRALHFAVDEGTEPRLQQLERLADPFVIGCGHVVQRESRSGGVSTWPGWRVRTRRPPTAAPLRWPAVLAACS